MCVDYRVEGIEHVSTMASVTIAFVSFAARAKVSVHALEALNRRVLILVLPEFSLGNEADWRTQRRLFGGLTRSPIGIRQIVGIPTIAVDLAKWLPGHQVRSAVAAVFYRNLHQIDRKFGSCQAASKNKGYRMLKSRYLLPSILCLTIGASAAMPVYAQMQRVSPPDIAGTVVDGNRVTVYYSRPFTKDPKTGAARKIWGGLIPYGKVWRAGANEATLLVTQGPIDVAGTTIPGGAFTLFVLPTEDGKAQLIVNKQIGQWGLTYDEKQDVGRVAMTKEELKQPVDQFTMAVQRNPAGGGVIKLMWESTQYSVPFTVKK